MAKDGQVAKRRKQALSPRKQQALLRYIARGDGSTAKWCKSKGIDPAAVCKLARRDSTFRQQLALAREDCTHAWAGQLIEIGDNEEGDVQRDRLKSDNRKFLMAKLNSSVYGDKLQVETTTKISLVDHLVETINVTPTLEAEED